MAVKADDWRARKDVHMQHAFFICKSWMSAAWNHFRSPVLLSSPTQNPCRVPMMPPYFGAAIWSCCELQVLFLLVRKRCYHAGCVHCSVWISLQSICCNGCMGVLNVYYGSPSMAFVELPAFKERSEHFAWPVPSRRSAQDPRFHQIHYLAATYSN